MLGRANPLARLAWTIRGVFAGPVPLRDGGRRVLAVAHRGAARHAPENTVAAFARALELGADGIEADLCATRDGVFVLWHDPDPDEKVALARQSGAEEFPYVPDVPAVGSPWRRPVRELSLEDFRIRCGYRRKEGPRREVASGDPPPEVPAALLEDLFDWEARETPGFDIFLDIKLQPPETAAAEGLLGLLRRRFPEGRARGLHLLCPQREIVQTLLAEARRAPLAPGIAVYPDFEFPGALAETRRLGARRIGMGSGRRLWADFLHEISRVVERRETGAVEAVVAWTINDERHLRRLVELPVDAILTDEPERLRRIFSERDAGAGSGRKNLPRAARLLKKFASIDTRQMFLAWERLQAENVSRFSAWRIGRPTRQSSSAPPSGRDTATLRAASAGASGGGFPPTAPPPAGARPSGPVSCPSKTSRASASSMRSSGVGETPHRPSRKLRPGGPPWGGGPG
jgi:glycerophosphoryl diester phosphodiesterase